MNTATFIKVSKSGKMPQFKELVGLRESGDTAELIDFVSMLHPNQAKIAQGSKATVHGDKTYSFTIYTTGILKTVQETGKRTFYKL